MHFIVKLRYILKHVKYPNPDCHPQFLMSRFFVLSKISARRGRQRQHSALLRRQNYGDKQMLYGIS